MVRVAPTIPALEGGEEGNAYAGIDLETLGEEFRNLAMGASDRRGDPRNSLERAGGPPQARDRVAAGRGVAPQHVQEIREPAALREQEMRGDDDLVAEVLD